MKTTLRREFREARRRVPRTPARDTALQQNLHRLISDLGPGEVLGHFPTEEEAQWAIEGELFYPVIRGSDMSFFRPVGPLVRNQYGIREPDPTASRPSKSPHLVLTPAVAVDTSGNRLGMGKGYYDRFFERHPRAIRVGVVYQVQVSATPLPVEGGDQRLDWIVTEEMILRTPLRSA